MEKILGHKEMKLRKNGLHWIYIDKVSLIILLSHLNNSTNLSWPGFPDWSLVHLTHSLPISIFFPRKMRKYVHGFFDDLKNPFISNVGLVY